MSVSIVTVATIKFSVESIVTIDTIVTELKKKYYEAKENIDFTRFLGNMYKEKNKSVSIVTVVTIKFSVERVSCQSGAFVFGRQRQRGVFAAGASG